MGSKVARRKQGETTFLPQFSKALQELIIAARQRNIITAEESERLLQPGTDIAEALRSIATAYEKKYGPTEEDGADGAY